MDHSQEMYWHRTIAATSQDTYWHRTTATGLKVGCGNSLPHHHSPTLRSSVRFSAAAPLAPPSRCSAPDGHGHEGEAQLPQYILPLCTHLQETRLLPQHPLQHTHTHTHTHLMPMATRERLSCSSIPLQHRYSSVHATVLEPGASRPYMRQEAGQEDGGEGKRSGGQGEWRAGGRAGGGEPGHDVARVHQAHIYLHMPFPLSGRVHAGGMASCGTLCRLLPVPSAGHASPQRRPPCASPRTQAA